MERPLILVTNDDGVMAPGIRALVDVAEELGDAVVVAPDKPQSGMGHAITIKATLRVHKIGKQNGTNFYSTSGTPVDCVKLAIKEVLNRKPDLIVSGINHGSNASTNVIYSGTMSAAIEGCMEGYPSIGFSLHNESIDADFEPSKIYVRKIMKKVLKTGLDKGVCLNVNIPNLNSSEIEGIKVCRQADASWSEKFDKRKDPAGKPYYWLTGHFENHDPGNDTDLHALEHNFVSVVPVQYDLTAYSTIEKMKKVDFNA